MSLYDTPDRDPRRQARRPRRPEGQRHAARERRVVLRTHAAVHRLEALQQKYADKGFSVIGLPCNQFGAQEPGTPEEIATFCSTNYNVTFPLTEKIEVNGDDRHPLYQELTQQPTPKATPATSAGTSRSSSSDRDGEVVARFSPVVEPEAAEITEAIEKALAAE